MIHINKYFINLMFAVLLAFVMMPTMVSVAGAYFTEDTEFIRSWRFPDEGNVDGHPVNMAIDPTTRYVYVLVLGGAYPKRDHFVQVIDELGEKLFRFGGYGTTDGKFYYPQGIAYYKGEIYVLDTAGRIQVFGADGRYIRTIQPTGDGSLYSPFDLAIASDTGKIFVTNTFSNRIKVFANNGDFLYQFGGFPTLYYPRGIKIGPDDNNLYVANQMRHNIAVFRQTGEFIRTIGIMGSGPLQFYSPYNLTMGPDGSMFVRDSNYTPRGPIQWITTDGLKFLGSFARYGEKDEDFYNVSGIAWDKHRGNIYAGGFAADGKQIKVLCVMSDREDDGIADDVDDEPLVPSSTFTRGSTRGNLPLGMEGKLTVKSDLNYPIKEEVPDRLVFRARIDNVNFISDRTGAKISLGKIDDWAAFNDNAFLGGVGVRWAKLGARKLAPSGQIVMKNMLAAGGKYKAKAFLKQRTQAVGYQRNVLVDTPEQHHFLGWPGTSAPVRTEFWDISKDPKELTAYCYLASAQEIKAEEAGENLIVTNLSAVDLILYDTYDVVFAVVVPGEKYIVGATPEKMIQEVKKKLDEMPLTGNKTIDVKMAMARDFAARALDPTGTLDEDKIWVDGNTLTLLHGVEMYDHLYIVNSSLAYIMGYKGTLSDDIRVGCGNTAKKIAEAAKLLAEKAIEKAKKAGIASPNDLGRAGELLAKAKLDIEAGTYDSPIVWLKQAWAAVRK